jgi:pimeloyl-ACP methyl ester carboxylesterase
MPALASAGYDCYALSLRGQGASRLGAGIGRVAAARGGVPLAVNVADIAAFVSSLEGPPPVLVGHSLGGTFVQEYLAVQIQQQQRAAQQRGPAGAPAAGEAQGAGDGAPGAGAGCAPELPPLPPLAGAVALASACAGTVMAFGDFVRDVGLREFVFQMYVVFSGAHLSDGGTARYCWWPEHLSEEDAATYHAAVKASSRALPYITAEVGAWAPAPVAGAGAAAAAAPPPVLAIGGEDDRIIRPFQVEAFGPHWGARVSMLPGVTHDAMLGGQALRVAVELLAWLEALPAAGGAAAEGVGDASAAAAARVSVLPLTQGLAAPGIGSGGGGGGVVFGSGAGQVAAEQRVAGV